MATGLVATAAFLALAQAWQPWGHALHSQTCNLFKKKLTKLDNAIAR